MPEFIIHTNIPRSAIPADYLKKATQLVAKTFDRQAELTIVAIVPDVVMSFGGTGEPCAIAEVLSVDRSGVEANKRYSEAIATFVQQELAIPSDRMFIKFTDDRPSNLGYKGTTFHGIL